MVFYPLPRFLRYTCSLLTVMLVAATVHAEITVDNSFSELMQPLPRYSDGHYAITQDLGKTVGPNLFHSFHLFNLRQGESAVFSGAGGIQNVISRVTGGRPSEINGTLRSELPHADIYLLNPAGLMFGPAAQLDVPGGFHAGSADLVKFADDSEFHADLARSSRFSSAAPVAFGFLDQAHGSVTVRGPGERFYREEALFTGLQVEEGQSLSLAGGDLEISQGAYIFQMDYGGVEQPVKTGSLVAPGGQIRLSAVAGAADVAFNGPPTTKATGGTLQLRDKALLDADGQGGGSIYIRAGRFVADDSEIRARTLGDEDGGVLSIRARDVTLSGGTRLDGTTQDTGHGTNVRIVADGDILLSGESEDNIATAADEYYANNTIIRTVSGIYRLKEGDDIGDGGEIYLEADNITLRDGALMSASTNGGGQGGNVFLHARHVFSADGEGRESLAGKGEALLAAGSSRAVDKTGIFTATYSDSQHAGTAGNLRIEAPEIVFSRGAAIRGQTEGAGNGGNVILQGDNVRFEGTASDGQGTNIFLATLGGDEGGDAGSLEIQANDIHFADGAFLLTSTRSAGHSSEVHLKAGNSVRFSDAHLYALVDSSGNGGNLRIEAEHIRFDQGAFILANTHGTGNTGNITLQASGDITFAGISNPARLPGPTRINTVPGREKNAIFFLNGGKGGLFAEVREDATGHGSRVNLEGDNIRLENGATLGVATYGPGNAGHLDITAAGTMHLSGTAADGTPSGIFASTIARGADIKTGNAGEIHLSARELILEEGAQIDVDSKANKSARSGDSGSLTIDVTETTRLSGVNPHGEYERGFASGIYAEVTGSGDNTGRGGDISLETGTLIVENGAIINSSTNNQQAAGKIAIKVRDAAHISGDSSHITLLEARPAQADFLKNHPSLDKEEALNYSISGIYAGSLSDAPNAGDSGDITLNAGTLTVSGPAAISTLTKGGGHGGKLDLVVAGRLQFADGALIEASTRGAGAGGDIVLQADTVHFNDAYIFAQVAGSGQGGNLKINAAEIVFERGAFVLSSTGGNGDAGDITLSAGGDIRFAGLDDATESGDAARLAAAPNATAEFFLAAGKAGLYAEVKNNAAGNSGDITITGQNVRLEKGAAFGVATYGPGAGGNFTLNAAGSVQMSGNDARGGATGVLAASISRAAGIHTGDAGNVEISADALTLEDGAGVAVSSSAPTGGSSGDSGNLTIRVAGETRLTGVNPHGPYEQGFASGIFAAVTGEKDNTGNGGNLTLNTGSLILEDGAVIASGTDNRRPAGHMTITVRDRLSIRGDSTAIERLPAREAQKAYRTSLQDDDSVSGIYADSTDPDPEAGDAGNLILHAGEVRLSDGGRISTLSEGGGDAGSITLKADSRVYLFGNSLISTEAKQAGGGQLSLQAGKRMELRHSQISSSVRQGGGDGGDLNIDARFLVQDHGAVKATAYEGSGGHIQITTKGIYPYQPVTTSPIDASSEKGESGIVTVNSPETDISGGLVVLPVTFSDNDNLNTSPCSAGAAAKTSRFAVSSCRHGVPTRGRSDLLPPGR